MKTLPATTQRAVKPCLSPVAVWQMLLTRLLEQHYGLTINDTPFCNGAVIKEHIDAGITLADAVNFLVEKYEPMDRNIALEKGLLIGDTLEVSYTVTEDEPGINIASAITKIH